MVAIFFEWPLFLAMVPSFALLYIFGKKHGLNEQDFIKSSKEGMKRNKNVAWLLFFIGMILPTWHYSGTISDLNALFLTLISPAFFFTITFLIAVMMSMIVGSAIATLSIVGVPLMAAADQLGLPTAIVAGALVSGGFVGDRSSPISSSFQLLRMATEIETRTHLRAITPTMVYGVLTTTAIFLLLDVVEPKGDLLVLDDITSFSEIPLGTLLISLIPPLTLLLMILLGKEMKLSFSLGIASAVIILLVRGVSPQEWLEGLIYGVNSLNGIIDMLPFVLFILVVGSYCQIMEDTKMVQPYMESIFSSKSSLKKNTALSIGVAAGVSLISPNQSFPIILTGRTLLPFWRRNFSAQHLSRILADTTVVFAGLVPWSLLAIMCSTIVGVPVLVYAPFAVFLLVMPIITFLYTIAEKEKEPLRKAG